MTLFAKPRKKFNSEKYKKGKKEEEVRSLFPGRFAGRLVTRNYVLIIPEYGSDLILVAVSLTVCRLLLLVPRVTAVGTILTPLLFYLRMRKTCGAAECSRAGCTEAGAAELMCTHYAVQWYVNVSVTRGSDDTVRDSFART